MHLLPPYTTKNIVEALHNFLMDSNIDIKLPNNTLDNCSMNNSVVRSLMGKIPNDALILTGEIFHMHYATYSLNLIVKKGLHAIDSSIEKGS